MANIDTFLTGATAVAREPIGGINITLENYISFAATSVSAADVVRVLKVPAGMMVTDWVAIVKTAEGAACTVTVGDGDGANSYDAELNLNSATGQYTTRGTDAYAVGKYYSAADTIDFTMGHDTDAAIVHVRAHGYMCERYTA